ncbi:Uncharacterised protein [Mycobacterium tuberculosis]|nr:Uncharacterised protein [Mycobacterium tuberculosis]CKT18378.1 Uncharacterised protein [Mycobacterium tuberculosis]
MGPRRPRRIHQPPSGIQRRIVQSGARAVQLRQQAAQTMRQRLLSPHAGQGGDRHVEASARLFDGVGKQRVGRQLREDPVAVLHRSLHRRGELHRVAQIVHPVSAIAHRLLARVEQGRRVVRHLGRHRSNVRQRRGQIVEYRIDLRRVRRHVDGHLARHHVPLLPTGDEVTNGVARTADHRGLRGRHHRDHNIVDSACHQLRIHLLGGQFHRAHGTSTGYAGHQLRAAANDARRVLERQCPRDDGRGRLTHRVSDDRARPHSVGLLHGGGQRDLNGEHCRLHFVDSGHGLLRRYRLGHRESRFCGDHRLQLGDGGREHWFAGEQLRAHRRPLRPLPGEDPDRSSITVSHRRVIEGVTVGHLAQTLDELRQVGGNHRGAHRPVRAATRQRVGQIRGRHAVLVFFHPGG